MKKKILFAAIYPLVLLMFMISPVIRMTAQNSKIDSDIYQILRIKPSEADPNVRNWDSVHVVYYDQAIKNNKILLWLTGTNGSTNRIPQSFFKTALDQGYRIIALSFISTPGVSQVCVGNKLNEDVNCAAEFRRKRIYGDDVFSSIPDQYQDAIIPRLIKLLQYLSKNDKEGEWSQYLDQNTDKPVWTKIAIAGQSQGGGMAEFIAQHESVARVLSFSGGWDYSNSKLKKIAGWYSQKSITPPENFFATYHVQELAAVQLAEICKTLNIPSDNVFALDEPLQKAKKGNNPFHTEGIANPVYKNIWIKMLGSGL
ncbi:hypothetical protein REB14_15785 [Chryseobacterium sp. ES2]|uniref:Alpha/beta hydrolase n=1 Tax=Chryseobacterium metallicongregator TaxID=3073042 RepID=A0ABU1E754_9FLAO|nr:hypothetical protein [Chryseobacterium sp. ES2]MDR4953639.1 hypothetical protein [Chryseobacterium sp. ES2]